MHGLTLAAVVAVASAQSLVEQYATMNTDADCVCTPVQKQGYKCKDAIKADDGMYWNDNDLNVMILSKDRGLIPFETNSFSSQTLCLDYYEGPNIWSNWGSISTDTGNFELGFYDCSTTESDIEIVCADYSQKLRWQVNNITSALGDDDEAIEKILIDGQLGLNISDPEVAKWANDTSAIAQFCTIRLLQISSCWQPECSIYDACVTECQGEFSVEDETIGTSLDNNRCGSTWMPTVSPVPSANPTSRPSPVPSFPPTPMPTTPAPTNAPTITPVPTPAPTRAPTRALVPTISPTEFHYTIFEGKMSGSGRSTETLLDADHVANTKSLILKAVGNPSYDKFEVAATKQDAEIDGRRLDDSFTIYFEISVPPADHDLTLAALTSASADPSSIETADAFDDDDGASALTISSFSVEEGGSYLPEGSSKKSSGSSGVGIVVIVVVVLASLVALVGSIFAVNMLFCRSSPNAGSQPLERTDSVELNRQVSTTKESNNIV